MLLKTARLSLALLIARVLLIDDIQLSFPANNFAVGASLLDRCSYFHFSIRVKDSVAPFKVETEPGFYLNLYVILPLVKS